MVMFRSLFPGLVAAQIVGIMLIALRVVPIVWLPFALVPARRNSCG
ncbi:hypothetical protein [uncultured Reyranella sp.]|nr:hypothetical protein [uncultured Reyranella sp.]